MYQMLRGPGKKQLLPEGAQVIHSVSEELFGIFKITMTAPEHVFPIGSV